MNPSPLRSARVTTSPWEVSDPCGSPVPLPPATVRAVVDEAVDATVAAHLRRHPDDDVRYVDPANPLRCATASECVPLELDLGPVTAGHLHRAGATNAAGFPPLTALGALVAAEVVRDLLDVRLVRAQHEVEDLSRSIGG